MHNMVINPNGAGPGRNHEKQRRQVAIRRLLARKEFSCQEDLVSALERAGTPATQASVSRDMREMGVVKVAGRYTLEVPRRKSAAADTLEAHTIRTVTPVGANLIVLKTPPGGASLVASFLDRSARAGLVGSVAGDDTVFIATQSRASQGQLLAWLRSLISKETS